ncbi:MAG: HD domain-containing protein [Thermoanaerobaculia bacterium]|nr:HD domain-containing protein [Thermoanaerobaculia bacterium]
MSPAGLLDLLLEAQALDRVPRTGYLLRGVARPESVSEHSFHVALLVWTLAAGIDEVDAARAVELALLHDLAEVRLGDLPMTAARYLPEGAKRSAEAAAAADLLAPLGDRALALVQELEEGTTPEARLVKACDKLQLMVKVAAYEAQGEGGLAEFWENEGNFPDGGFPEVAALFDELRRRARRRG